MTFFPSALGSLQIGTMFWRRRIPASAPAPKQGSHVQATWGSAAMRRSRAAFEARLDGTDNGFFFSLPLMPVLSIHFRLQRSIISWAAGVACRFFVLLRGVRSMMASVGAPPSATLAFKSLT